MLETGRILQDRYRVERQVGQGGMGSVYLATDERFHSTVAIKETLFGDEKLRRAFSREARLLNSLKHSALPKVTDHFVEDNGQYIVMEYIDGDDLFETMRKSGHAFPVEDVLSWADQLLDALFYLHSQGIIHRDIKPQNLKLTKLNQIVLLDFGLAKGNPTDANFQTAPQSIFGYSRNYASLEQIQGTGTDPRSDIYSLAATVYHLITGQVPADALTRVMMVLNDNKDPLEPAGKFNSSISQEVSDALQLCLSLKAGSRPQNVEETRKLLKIERHTPFVLADAENLTSAGREDLLTQNTMVLDGGGVSRDKPSELKTEVLETDSGSDSFRTKLANKPTFAVPPKASGAGRLGIAAAGVALLLIVGSIAAAVVFWPTGETPVPDGNTNMAESMNPVPEETADTNGNTAETIVDDNSVNVSSLPQYSDQTPDIVPVATPTVSNSKDTQKATKSGTAPSSDQAVDTVVIENGTVRTKEVNLNDKGVTVVRPTEPARDRPVTREQLKNLTPAQRRRLLQKLEADRLAAEQRRRELLKQQIASPPPAPPPPQN